MIKECYFAGGCFWCIASIFTSMPGVKEVIDGYSGGIEENPTYEQVKSQLTGHRETIKIIYDDSLVSYKKLFKIFLNNVDPFDAEGQFIDRGHSYTLAVYYLDENEKETAREMIKELEEKSQKTVQISVEKFLNFYTAEEYHQNYHLKNPEEFAKELISSGRKKITSDLFVRKTTLEDLPKVMEIFKSAREFMKDNGNYDQWHDNWPPEYIIREDISKGISHVVTDSNNEIYATFMLLFGVDPTYLEINGAWISNEEYGVIHRLASSRKIKGMVPFVMEYAKTFNKNIRMDTHENNKPMRRQLEKCGFIYCGIISPIEGGDRGGLFTSENSFIPLIEKTLANIPTMIGIIIDMISKNIFFILML